MSSDIDKQDCEKSTIEFHFQEIFTGEQIVIKLGDEVRAQIVAKTRFQTGLAHIESLELCEGEEVTLYIGEMDLKAIVKVDVSKPFVTVKMRDGQLQVENTAMRPGYL